MKGGAAAQGAGVADLPVHALDKAKIPGCTYCNPQIASVGLTEAKAKEISGLAEQLITLAKRGDLPARRQAIARLADEEVVRKLFDEIAPKYKGISGGYTRILKTGPRRGDAAEMCIIELVDVEADKAATAKATKAKAAKKTGETKKAAAAKTAKTHKPVNPTNAYVNAIVTL